MFLHLHLQQPVNCICVRKMCDVRVYGHWSPCSGSCSQPSPVGGAILAAEVGPTQIGIKHLMIDWLGPHHNIEIIITLVLCRCRRWGEFQLVRVESSESSSVPEKKLKNWHIGLSTSTCESARYSTLQTRSFGRVAMDASKCFGEICGKLVVTFFSWRISSLPDFQPWQGCQAAHIPKPTELRWCGGAPR